MKKIALACLLVLGLAVKSQKAFPTLKGTDLNNKPVTLPVGNGKYTVVAIAFSRSAEDDLKRWLKPLHETFVKKEANAGGLSPAEVNDVNFYFVPLISGFKKFADDFRSGTDKELWEYIMDTEKTDIKDVQKKLGVEDTKIPYFFVLDKDGKIVETQSGVFNPAKIDKLEDAVE